MARLIGYMGNRRDSLGDVLHQERQALVPKQSTSRNASWGIGFYQSGEVLHKKRPLKPGAQIDWEMASRGVLSDCVVAHLRQPTVGDYRSENVHPFRMRSWLFAHQGTIDRFDLVRDSVLETLPDFVRRNIRGNTDSELFFHLALSFLYDDGNLENPDVRAEEVAHALRSSVALIDRLSEEVGGKLAKLNLILTHGRQTFALRRGDPMGYIERQGLFDPITRQSRPPPEEGTLRYVLVVSGGAELPSDYQEIPDGSLIAISRELDVRSFPL